MYNADTLRVIEEEPTLSAQHFTCTFSFFLCNRGDKKFRFAVVVRLQIVGNNRCFDCNNVVSNDTIVRRACGAPFCNAACKKQFITCCVAAHGKLGHGSVRALNRGERQVQHDRFNATTLRKELQLQLYQSPLTTKTEKLQVC